MKFVDVGSGGAGTIMVIIFYFCDDFSGGISFCDDNSKDEIQ